jgi:hypothetical protein
MVLGCSTPSERAPSGPVKPIVTTTDASIADASQIAVELPPPNKCLDPKRPGYNRCNPPAPAPADARAQQNVEGNVTSIERKPEGVYFTV